MYYTVCQVASMLNVSPETVRRWIRKGDLNAIKPNYKKEGFRIDEDSISEFINNRKKYKVLREPMSQQTLEKIKRLREIQRRIEKLEKIVSEIDDLLESL